jgi:hypothetical protein
MTAISREEADARLATVEERGNTRFAELNGNIIRLSDAVGRLTADVGGLRADNAFTRWTLVLAVLAGLAALWVTQANLLAAFQTALTLKAH